MKKILNIGGNDVAFECNAVTSILYKQEFNKDYFAEMMKLVSLQDAFNDPKKLKAEDFEKMDFDVITRLAWACAKTADRNTKSFIDWLYDNPEFNFAVHGLEVTELVLKNLETKKK